MKKNLLKRQLRPVLFALAAVAIGLGAGLLLYGIGRLTIGDRAALRVVSGAVGFMCIAFIYPWLAATFEPKGIKDCAKLGVPIAELAVGAVWALIALAAAVVLQASPLNQGISAILFFCLGALAGRLVARRALRH